MFSVALIGADGAGKTTIARMLENSFPIPVKCIYMGVAIESTNVALPTSRLALKIKKMLAKGGNVSTASESRSQQIRTTNSGRVRAALRLTNRIAEEWYRQLLSWSHQKRGFIVVYDRHFQFDFEYESDAKDRLALSDRIHRWCLHKLYPDPDLVLYLDAPPEVLYSRKHEGTIEWLASRRASFQKQGASTDNFVQVDATRPLDIVYADVSKQIMHFYTQRLALKEMIAV
jgi:thymidylate kinase